MISERAKRTLHFVLIGRLDYLLYPLWVRWKRLDFYPVTLENLGFSRDHSVPHSASGGTILADVLKEIDIPPGSRVVDLGCGKGSAMCTLARFPFEEVAGVELCESLARIAEANGRKLGLTNFRVHVSDATEFKDFDRFTHIYMFNPFPAAVMTEVMNNLAASLSRKPRQLTVIYLFPVCHDVLVQSGLLRKQRELDVKFTHPYFIYAHGAPVEPVVGVHRSDPRRVTAVEQPQEKTQDEATNSLS
jgi:SAM-dependent methyltransferase